MTLTNAEVDGQGQWWYRHKNGTRQRLELRNCTTCGSEFPAFPSSSLKWCSRACSREDCRRCGKTFHPGQRSQGYCSLACKRAGAMCENCGKIFTPTKKSSGRFCSRECYYEWKVPTGTRRVESIGYVMIKVPKDTDGSHLSGNRSSRWMWEHRYVMQQKLGRTLGSHEHVHHINGDRADNRPENLELWKSKSGGRQPFGVRSADYHCPGCRCFD